MTPATVFGLVVAAVALAALVAHGRPHVSGWECPVCHRHYWSRHRCAEHIALNHWRSARRRRYWQTLLPPPIDRTRTHRKAA